jgi:hypothetical protein
MRSAPAFELTLGPGWAEKATCSVLGAAAAGAPAAWLGSHLETATVGPLPLLVIGLGVALAGGWLAWTLTPRRAGRVAWHDGHWALQLGLGPPQEGSLQPMLDLGSWLLLRFRPLPSGRTRWLGVGRCSAGAAWHPLRATLFAPGRAQRSDAAGEGARS